MFLKAKTYNLKAAFTLIELLVVIAIISLLSSIVLASLGTARDKARDAAIQSDLTGVRSSAEIFFTDNGQIYGDTGNLTYFPEKNCPDTSCDGSECSMFHSDGPYNASSIYNAIQHAESQTGVVGRCAAVLNTYAVSIPLAITLGPGTQDYWCVDSSNVSKRISVNSPVDAIIGGSSKSCP